MVWCAVLLVYVAAFSLFRYKLGRGQFETHTHYRVCAYRRSCDILDDEACIGENVVFLVLRVRRKDQSYMSAPSTVALHPFWLARVSTSRLTLACALRSLLLAGPLTQQ